MKPIYLDNSSTSFPKPHEVAQAMYHYLTEVGSNINRGGYQSAYELAETVFETRQLLCRLFKGEDCRQLVFTKNVTESLNILLKGYLKAGDHVLVSSLEHNAVMRPLNQLKGSGVSFSRIPCHPDGNLYLETAESLLTPSTKAVIMTHASNVCGTLMPLEEVGAFCRDKGLRFFVDSAQTAGICPLDMKRMNIDALAFTGHKSLMGPQGIGGFLLRPGFEAELSPLLSGGTGSFSDTELIPCCMPDRFEAGTLNLPGIIGLRAALLWLEQTGHARILQHELSLTEEFLTALKPLQEAGKLKILGRMGIQGRIGVVSIQTPETDLAQLAYQLEQNYSIMTRVGLHCAPAAHKALGSFPKGSLRFSFGWWNSSDEIQTTVQALQELLYGL